MDEIENIVMTVGQNLKLPSNDIHDVFSNNEKSIKIIKKKGSYYLSCIGHENTRIKIIYKNTFSKVISVTVDTAVTDDNTKIGMKNFVNSRRVLDFWNIFDRTKKTHLQCMYYDCSEEDLSFYSRVISESINLGVKEIFLLMSPSVNISFVVEYIIYRIRNANITVYIVSNSIDELLRTKKNKRIELVISVPINYIDTGIFYTLSKKQGISHIAFDASNTRSFSNDDWLDTLLYIKKARETSKILYSIIYNLPPGYTNDTLDISPYTKARFPLHTNTPTDYESTATLFFFGGTTEFRETEKNVWGDSIYKTIDTTIFPEHLCLARKHGVRYLLFGPADKNSTTNVPWKHSVYRVTDSLYTFSKINKK
jgi:hypothetical protein